MANEAEPSVDQRQALICIDLKNDTVDVPTFRLVPPNSLTFYQDGRYQYVDLTAPEPEEPAEPFTVEELAKAEGGIDVSFQFGNDLKIDVLTSLARKPNIRVSPRNKTDFSVYSPSTDYHIFVGTTFADIETKAASFLHHLSQAQTSSEETPFRPETKPTQWFKTRPL